VQAVITMTEIIFDSSVALKWVVEEDDSIVAASIRDHALVRACQCTIIDLAYIEMTNAIWLKHRRGIMSEADCHLALKLLIAFPLSVVPLVGLLQRALEIGIRYTISPYDAAFVAAVELNSSYGCTADVPLVEKVKTDFPKIKLLSNWNWSPT
jgi:predicted nucleic acid-binding protein